MDSKTNLNLLNSWIKADKSDDFVINSEKELHQQADKKILQLFNEVSKRIPAYKDFLKKHNIDPSTIKTISDFKNLPLTTKENYIEQYPFEERIWDGDISKMHMISTSSGTTGEPHFWPRDLRTEIDGAIIHEMIFREVLQIKEKKALFINGFAMGNWIAGTFTSASVNLVAWKGYAITLMSPGYDKESILDIVKRIGSKFEKIVISGHIPFLKEVVESGINLGIDWKSLDVQLLGTGQGVTENWRDYMLKLLGAENSSNTIINLYGSADASLMGFESELSIKTRKKLTSDRRLTKKLFGSDRLPSLYVYDPRFTYFEAVDSELCITKNSGCPLIRYNIHDEGGIISSNELLLRKSNSSFQSLPLVYLFGRDKFMVKIYGANVYTEHVQHALNHEKLQPLLTGRHLLEIEFDTNENPQMVCRIELNPDITESPELIILIEEIFVEEVRKLNSEYDFLLHTLGDKVKPRITLYEHGHMKYFPKGKIKKTA